MHVVSVCPLRVASQLWQPPHGGWVLTVVCKATYQLAPTESALAEVQEYCQEEENHWNDEATHSLYAPSDLAPFKPSPEVMLVGHAFAPRGEPVARLLVHLAVGEVDKSIEIRGDQSFQRDGALRDGPRFGRMPLRYERAAGGPDTLNPVGLQLDVANSLGIVLLPNLRPPGRADLEAGDFIEPVGFGPIAASWPTRRRRLGALAGGWSEAALTHEPMPEGIDPTYFMSAPPDQALGVLRSDERIVLENLHSKHPRLVTNLPGIEPRAFLDLPQQAPSELRLVCDTLWIDTDRAICTLTWRGQVSLLRPEQQGRVVVAMEKTGRPLSWAEVEPLTGERTQHPAHATRERDGDRTDVPRPAAVSPPTLPFGGPSGRPEPAIELTPPNPRQTARIPGDVTAPFGNRGGAAPAWLPEARVDPPPSPPSRPPPIALSRVLGRPSSLAQAPPAPPPPGLASPMTAPPMVAPPMGPPMVAPPMGPPMVAPPMGPPMTAPPMPPPPPSVPGHAPVSAPAPAMLVVSARDASPWGSGAQSSSSAPSGPLFPLVAGAAPAVASAAVSPAEASWLQSTVRAAPSPAAEAQDKAQEAQSGAAQPGAAQPSVREHVDLIGFDPAALSKIKASAAAAPSASAQAGPVSWLAADAGARVEPQDVIDRRDVVRVLTRTPPATEEALSRAVSSAFRDDGSFEPPVTVIAGEVSFAFDELEALKATVTVTTPFVGLDKKLREAVAAGTEVLKAEWKPPADVAEGFTHRIEEAFAQGPRAVAPGYLQTSVKRMLLESRSYQKRSVFGERRIRALWNLAGRAQVPAYLPEALGPKLPLFVRFRATAIVELRPQEDEHETHPDALLVLALGRLLRERS